MRQWTLLAVVAILAILAGGWFLLVQPKSDKAAEVRAATEAQDQANARLQTEITRLEKQAAEMPALQAKLAKFATRIPDNPALPTLIRTLTDAADRAGVELVSLAPSPPVAMAVAAPAAGAPAAATTPGAAPVSAAGALAATEPLFQIPITLSVHGGYVQVQQFFSNIEDLTRSMQVGAFTVAPFKGSADSSTVSANDVVAAITGRVYMTAPTAAPAAPITAASPALVASPVAVASPSTSATPAQ